MAVEQFSSPDGTVTVTVNDEGGKPTYQVSLNGVTVLEPSPLGLKANFADLTQGLKLTACQVTTFTDSYDLKTIKQRHVSYEATQAVCQFEGVCQFQGVGPLEGIGQFSGVLKGFFGGVLNGFFSGILGNGLDRVRERNFVGVLGVLGEVGSNAQSPGGFHPHGLGRDASRNGQRNQYVAPKLCHNLQIYNLSRN